MDMLEGVYLHFVGPSIKPAGDDIEQGRRTSVREEKEGRKLVHRDT
jgi:hypothetical protein